MDIAQLKEILTFLGSLSGDAKDILIMYLAVHLSGTIIGSVMWIVIIGIAAKTIQTIFVNNSEDTQTLLDIASAVYPSATRPLVDSERRGIYSKVMDLKRANEELSRQQLQGAKK